MKYLICGRDGSGKSRLAYELKKLGFNTLKTYTTRKPRHEKEDSYHFITKEDINNYDDRCLEMEYNDETYFARKSDVETADVMVLDPTGITEIIELFPETSFHIIWINAKDADARKEQAMRRAEKATDPKAEKENLEKRSEDPRFDIFENVLRLPNAIALNATCVHFIENDFNKNTMHDVAQALQKQFNFFNNLFHILQSLINSGNIPTQDGMVKCENKNNQTPIGAIPPEIAVDITVSSPASLNQMLTTWLMNTKLT